MPAFTGGDCTSTAGSVALNCTKTGGVSFGYFATGTDAANLTGTVAAARMPAFTGGDVTSSAGSVILNAKPGGKSLAFTGTSSKWPWQLNADGTWDKVQPQFSDLANVASQLFGAQTVWTPPAPVWGTNYGVYSGLLVNVGGLPTASMLGGGAGATPQALAGALDIPGSDIGTFVDAGISGHARTASTTSPAVGVFGGGMANVAGAKVWSMNSICTNSGSIIAATQTGFNNVSCVGHEVDVNYQKLTGGGTPSGTARGLWVVGGSEVVPSGGAYAMEISPFGSPASGGAFLPWSVGIQIDGQPSAYAVQIGTISYTNAANSPSQLLAFQGSDGSGTIRTATIGADAAGGLLFEPSSTSRIVYLRDGSGNDVLTTSPFGITLKQTPTMSTLTGYVYCNASLACTAATTVPVGNLSGLGTGVATALATAVTGSGSIVLATAPSIVNSLTFSGVSSNVIYYGNVGTAGPGSSSTGQKIQLFGIYGSIGPNDYAIGVESGYLWNNSGGGFKWYSNTTLVASMSSAGLMSLPGGLDMGGANITNTAQLVGPNAANLYLLHSSSGAVVIGSASVSLMVLNAAANLIYPGQDNAYSFGRSSERWSAIYATTYYGGAGVAGVSCSGAPTASFASTGGIVTHC